MIQTLDRARPIFSSPSLMPLPTSFSLPYIAAQSKCLYPVCNATDTASEALDLSKFQVPKPKAGMEAMEGAERLGLKGICSLACDNPRSANVVEKSFIM